MWSIPVYVPVTIETIKRGHSYKAVIYVPARTIVRAVLITVYGMLYSRTLIGAF